MTTFSTCGVDSLARWLLFFRYSMVSHSSNLSNIRLIVVRRIFSSLKFARSSFDPSPWCVHINDTFFSWGLQHFCWSFWQKINWKRLYCFRYIRFCKRSDPLISPFTFVSYRPRGVTCLCCKEFWVLRKLSTLQTSWKSTKFGFKNLIK